MPHRSPLDVVGTDLSGRSSVRTHTSTAIDDLEIFKFGKNLSVSITERRTVWTGSNIKSWPTANAPFYIASDNAADTSIPIIIDAIDEDYTQQTITAPTDAIDGTTPVSIGDFIGIQRARRSSPAIGNIWGGPLPFVAGVPDDPQMHIPVDAGSTFHGFYIVPSRIHDFDSYNGRWRASIMGTLFSSIDRIRSFLRVQVPGYDWWTIDEHELEMSPQETRFGTGLDRQLGGVLFGPGTRLTLEAQAVSGSGAVYGRMDLRLVRYNE